MQRTQLITTLSIALIGVSCISAGAAMVTDGATTVFLDDFERDTVGLPPSNPGVGTWAWVDGSLSVKNDPIPSPAPGQGQNYLAMIRPVSSTAVADFGAVSSGPLTALFKVYIPTGSSSDLVQISLSPTNEFPGVINIFQAPVWLTNIGTTLHTYVGPGFDASDTDTGVPFVTGVWQTWKIEYTFNHTINDSNDDTFTVTVDGISSSPMNAGGYANVADPASLRYLGFRTGANGTFYVDVPEPQSLAIVGLAAVVGARLRRPRRSRTA